MLINFVVIENCRKKLALTVELQIAKYIIVYRPNKRRGDRETLPCEILCQYEHERTSYNQPLLQLVVSCRSASFLLSATFLSSFQF